MSCGIIYHDINIISLPQPALSLSMANQKRKSLSHCLSFTFLSFSFFTTHVCLSHFHLCLLSFFVHLYLYHISLSFCQLISDPPRNEACRREDVKLQHAVPSSVLSLGMACSLCSLRSSEHQCFSDPC